LTSPPTFVAEYESTTAFGVTAASKTAAVTVATGDVLAIMAVTADDATDLTSPPTGGGLTYSLTQSITAVDFCQIMLWTAVSASGQSFTLTVNRTIGTDFWGFNCLRFGASNGIGASASTSVASGAPVLDLATQQDNSAIVVVAADWNAVDGAARTYRGEVNFAEMTYFRDGAAYTVYVGYHPDSGSGGNTHSVGVLSPSGQKYSIAAVEIKGLLDVNSATPDPLGQVKRRSIPMRRR
jgi:hypothetical protein